MFIILTFSYCKHYTIAFLAFQPYFLSVFFLIIDTPVLFGFRLTRACVNNYFGI